jgi:hypothetical protein
MPLDPALHPRLLCSLAAASEANRVGRKLLLASTRGEARELLRALTLASGGSIGWSAVTIRDIAHEIAGEQIAMAGLEIIDDLEMDAMIDDAFDAVIAAGGAGPFAPLANGVGIREALHNSVRALRTAGIDAEIVRAADLEDEGKASAVASILERYEAALAAAGRIDGAGVLVTAVEVAGRTPAKLPRDVHILPGIGLRGLAGRLVRMLIDRGAIVLEADPVVGLPVPGDIVWEAGEAVSPLSHIHGEDPGGAPEVAEVAFFRATGTADEAREVLRRVVAAGVGYDQVEVIATDAREYGGVFDGIGRQVASPGGEAGVGAVPIGYSFGLGLERTRIGATIAGYLRWVAEGFPSIIIREMLASGQIHPRHGADQEEPTGISGARLAARLRALRIGWGRDRYLEHIDRALAADPAPPRDGEDEEALREREARERAELQALRPMIAALVESAPDRRGSAEAGITPAAIASGMLALLRFTPAGDHVENTGRRLTRDHLLRIERTLTRPMPFESALARLRNVLELRLPAPEAGGSAPWISSPGHLHLSPLSTGGLSGRRRVFVVGLDADRTAGPGVGDPVLNDRDRIAINRAAGQEVDPAADHRRPHGQPAVRPGSGAGAAARRRHALLRRMESGGRSRRGARRRSPARLSPSRRSTGRPVRGPPGGTAGGRRHSGGGSRAGWA